MDEQKVREEIQSVILRSLMATKNKDMAVYLNCLTPDFVVRTREGKTIILEELEKDIRRDWNLIISTLALTTDIELLTVNGDEASVLTRQRYVRQMRGRDKKSEHQVETSVRHRELWVRTGDGWKNNFVEEIEHGPVLVDGQIYDL